MSRVIHFDSGKSFNGPISGRHTIALCGQHGQDKCEKSFFVKIKTEVTCKNCLNKLNKKVKE